MLENRPSQKKINGSINLLLARWKFYSATAPKSATVGYKLLLPL